jgi:hypothetical protein
MLTADCRLGLRKSNSANVRADRSFRRDCMDQGSRKPMPKDGLFWIATMCKAIRPSCSIEWTTP